jgi:hypothetical protein
VKLTGAIAGYALQLVVVSSAVHHIGVGIGVVGSYYGAWRPAGDERFVELDGIARLARAAPEVEADVLYLTGRLPLEENLAIAGGSGEVDQGDGRLNGHGRARKEQAQSQQPDEKTEPDSSERNRNHVNIHQIGEGSDSSEMIPFAVNSSAKVQVSASL